MLENNSEKPQLYEGNINDNNSKKSYEEHTDGLGSDDEMKFNETPRVDARDDGVRYC